MSSPLTAYAGAMDQPYRHHVLLCQPHFTSKSISIAFYVNGTAYFEYLTEEKIRQRLQLLNNSRKASFHQSHLASIIARFTSMFSVDAVKRGKHELHAKLITSHLLSVEIHQDDLKFKFRCDERPELFEQHYVRQLLLQVKELAQRQTYLCELLEHKNEFSHFDAALFLSSPMTLDDDQEGEDDGDESVSSSTTGRLWKAAFGHGGGQQCLDICLLKKAYMKTVEEVSDDEPDVDTVASIVTSLVDEIEAQDDDDDIGLSRRIAKRSLASGKETQATKRLRKCSGNGHLSI